jgi:hypothetical protein
MTMIFLHLLVYMVNKDVYIPRSADELRCHSLGSSLFTQAKNALMWLTMYYTISPSSGGVSFAFSLPRPEIEQRHSFCYTLLSKQEF